MVYLVQKQSFGVFLLHQGDTAGASTPPPFFDNDRTLLRDAQAPTLSHSLPLRIIPHIHHRALLDILQVRPKSNHGSTFLTTTALVPVPVLSYLDAAVTSSLVSLLSCLTVFSLQS